MYSLKQKDSINTNDSSLNCSPSLNSWGIADFGFSCSNKSSHDENSSAKEGSFEAIVQWFDQKGVKPGNPDSICEDFMNQKRESIKGISSQGVFLSSSSLLSRRNRSLIVS